MVQTVVELRPEADCVKNSSVTDSGASINSSDFARERNLVGESATFVKVFRSRSPRAEAAVVPN